MQPKTNTTYAAKFSGYGFFVGMAAMFILPSSRSMLQNAFIGAIFGVGGSALGAALGSFVDSLREKTEGMPQSSPTSAGNRFF